MGIYSDSSSVSLYPSQITLYRSLHIHRWSILKFTIWEISYLSFLSIITRAEASCVFSEKVLDVAGLSIDTWKTRWTEHMDSGRQRVNNSVPGVKIAEGGLNLYLALSFLFYFLFHFQSVFLFLELGSGLSDKDHTVTWHGHKSHDAKKDVEGSGRMMSYNMLNTCWPYGIHMAV